MQQINAVLLAGDRRASIEVRSDNKAFLMLEGAPLFIHVLRALKRSERVRNVVVVGPADRLEQNLHRYEAWLSGDGEVAVAEQGENIIENFKTGFVCSLALTAKHSFEELRGSEYDETVVLVLPCDIPLLTPWEVDEFIRRSNMDDYDYSIGITSEKILSYYHPSPGIPGIQMIYFHVREDLLRHNNLHLGKPLKFAHLDYIEKMYEWRYQTRLANIIRMVFSLLFAGWRLFKGLRIFILMQLSLYYDRHGHPKLSDRVRSLVPMTRLCEGVGNVFGSRVQIIYTHFGGAALDVDNEGGLAVIEEMYGPWMEHQETMSK
ncbi:MAG: nucleotidyltransferase family protein [Kiritimatiellales bacterium]|nr:nucleotidyltransferase family protein [Kiritimatiellales bacterium]